MQHVSAPATAPEPVQPAAESPRRERKKRQTRDALLPAALRLFDAYAAQLTPALLEHWA